MQCIKKSYVNIVPRLMAYLIDVLIVTLGSSMLFGGLKMVAFFGDIEFLRKGVLFQYSIIAIATYIVERLYFIIMTSISGQTFGKMCFRIKVVNKDGEKITFWNAVYRETIGRYLSAVFCNLGYFVILIDSEKKGLHDMLCDTRVIYDTKINNEEIKYYPPKKVNVPDINMNMQNVYVPVAVTSMPNSNIQNSNEGTYNSNMNMQNSSLEMYDSNIGLEQSVTESQKEQFKAESIAEVENMVEMLEKDSVIDESIYK